MFIGEHHWSSIWINKKLGTTIKELSDINDEHERNIEKEDESYSDDEDEDTEIDCNHEVENDTLVDYVEDDALVDYVEDEN
jgi:tRNA U34 2-thiouridine synthase MnmA/TrmU